MRSVQEESIPTLVPGAKFVTKKSGEYAYIYLPDGTIKIVNMSAIEILKLCDGKRTVRDIAEVIAKMHGLELNVAIEEVKKFLHEAARLHVVKIYEK